MNFILKKWRFFLDCFSSSNGKLALKKNAIVDYLDYQISSGRFRSQKVYVFLIRVNSRVDLSV